MADDHKWRRNFADTYLNIFEGIDDFKSYSANGLQSSDLKARKDANQVSFDIKHFSSSPTHFVPILNSGPIIILASS